MSVFSDALERVAPADRAAYLDEACRGNAEFRRLVEEMLAAYDRAGRFLEPDSPAASVASSAATLPVTESGAAEDPARAEPSTAGYDPDGPGSRAASVSVRSAETAGTVVAGRYKLLQLIGEGGMGSVWMADQTEPVKRRVAVKLIHHAQRGGSRTILSRFEAERQAIALMDHPHIARLFDAGVTADGSPFFIMELVKGVPLNEYCDDHKLDVRERLQLFTQVCSAVQHAHQKGIIHRDLKPTNILVENHDGKAVPKVIDFGLAKATSGLQLSENTLFTAFGSVMGTPLYMAPEQADFNAVDVDTRTDVYALGVILYELLTGTTPITRESLKQAALDEMLRLIREHDAPTPSSRLSTVEAMPSVAANRRMEPRNLGRFVKGELDWIVMKALSKERARRYETANGFARDVERFLSHEPVQAGPPTARYRFGKFIRRNRGQAIAASLVLLALAAGMVGTTIGLFEARRQEERANVEAEGERKATQKALAAAQEERKAKESVETVLGFMESKVFAAARPKEQDGGLGYDVKLVDAIKSALPGLEKEFHGRPQIEARIRRTMAKSFHLLGKYALALEQSEAAYNLCRRELGPYHPETLRSMSNVANSYYDVGRQADALKLYEETAPLLKTHLAPDDDATSSLLISLANLYSESGRYSDALKVHEEALRLRKGKLGPDHPETLIARLCVAVDYTDLGRHAEALKLYEENLPLLKAKLGPDHPTTLITRSNLADGYAVLGRQAEALKLHEETLPLLKAKYGLDHYYTLMSMMSLACCNVSAGRTQQARSLLEECYAAGRNDPERSWLVAALQSWYGFDDDYAATRRRIFESAGGTSDPTTALRAAQSGALAQSTDRAILQETLELGRKALQLNKEEGRGLLALGMTEFRNDLFAEAARDLQVVSNSDQSVTAAQTAAFYRAMSLFRLGRKDEAVDVAAKAGAKMKPLPVQGNPMSGDSNPDVIILWLAYKEAKAMIGFLEPVALPTRSGGQ